ncbi:MAG TPA: aldo/keto reductase [Anaerolineae bacterium]|nr:aldo/keto reductase [Anaerolineae bacterium]
MNYRNLGRTGLRVSQICLGMMSYGTPTWRPWVLDEDASRPFVKRALDLGINFFDTADMYSLGVSEQVTGRLLNDLVRRQDVVIATKLYFPLTDDPNNRGLSRKHIMDAIDASLQRLNTDYVDLYQIHRWDYDTPIEETMEALHDVVKSGKARYIGASSMYAWQFAKAQHTADKNGWTKFISMQNHYNLVYREEEREMNPLCRDQGVGLIPWSPLARGFLAGNRAKPAEGPTARSQSDGFADAMYFADADFAVLDAVKKIAQNRDISPAQVALAWLCAQDGVTAPIIGATKMHHLEEAVAAANITLTPDECQTLETPYIPHRILGHS